MFVPVWVVNLTPDSFSDGGEWLKANSLTTNLSSLPSNFVIDIGAESTAPKTKLVSSESEIERLDKYFFTFLDNFKGTLNLSIDTYKIETINWCLKKIKKYPSVLSCYWNDVSGQYQDGVMDILKAHPHLRYVLCHNLVSKRSEVHEHAKITDAKINMQQEVPDFFSKALNYFSEYQLSNRIILDPGFGFAKTREQNLGLLKFLPELTNFFSNQDFLIGISRKTFLREEGKSIKDPGQLELVTKAEIDFLKTFKQHHFQQKIYWRSHSQSLLSSI